MIVIAVTDCPPRLRGDLSKWLIEINAGVYVGCVNSRVREELWKRVKAHLSNGRATMVFSANNEQKLDFYVHNTSWFPVDYDGLKLMCRPLPGKRGEASLRPFQSSVSLMHKADRIAATRRSASARQGYVVLDLETTGLNPQQDELLEIGALRVVDHQIVDKLEAIVQTRCVVPEAVQKLTGITLARQQEEGIPLADALSQLSAFLLDRPIVCHNANFDRQFLRAAYERSGRAPIANPFTDTLTLARRIIDDVADYRLGTLAEYFELPKTVLHQALSDCETTFQLYEKLNEIR